MNNIIKIICILIGTFIGAGFASGKEIYLFFYKYKIWGILGLLISCIILSYNIFKVIKITKNNKIENYDDFLEKIIKNKILKILLKNIINIFLAMSFCIMISGFVAFMKQEFNFNIIISSILILISCYFTFKHDINGIIKINNILIPIIIIVIIFIGIKKANNFDNSFLVRINLNNFKIESIIYSILYANYNLLTIVPILITTQKIIKRKKAKIISILFGSIIFILSIVLCGILNNSNININNIDMPIVHLVGKYGIIYKCIYCIIIGIAIFTTAISAGYGYLQKYEKNKKIYNEKIILLMCIAFICLPIGFSKLIELLYPIFGILGIIQSLYILKNR